MVSTGDWQFSQLSLATLEPSLKALPLLSGGLAVRDDSKLGMLGTEGKGELLTPSPIGLKLLANSALEGRAGPAPA